MKITKCRVNHLEDPIGFELPETVFSWRVEDARGKYTKETRIVVKNADKTVAADTGWGTHDPLGESIALELKPRTRYTWTVAVRTDAGEEAVSEAHFFETGKMKEEWAGKWIGCDETEARHPVFSRCIEPASGKTVQDARLYICGLGVYEARLNGRKIGREYLAPGFTDYHRWIQAQTYDITADMQSAGELRVMLGNGWYKGRIGYKKRYVPYFGEAWKLIAEVRIRYTDGTEDVIGTDETWKVTRSAITFSNIYDGEHRDDTLLAPVSPEHAVRSEDVFNASPECIGRPEDSSAAAPEHARLTEAPTSAAPHPEEYPEGTVIPDGNPVLSDRLSPPVTVHECFPVKEVIHTPSGETVLDIGQNIAGIFRLRVHEPYGTQIRLQFGEILQDGHFYRENLRTAKAEYIYVSDGTEKVIEPVFTYYGFRYVKLDGAAHFSAEDFTAEALYSDIPMEGELSTGSPLVDQLISNTRWGMKGNFVDVPTDCPQRDERLGWTGDAEVFSQTALYLADPYAFYTKYLKDMREEQAEHDGMVPDYVPNVTYDPRCSSAWGDAATIIPHHMYLYTGDPSILKHAYPGMKAWVDYMTRTDGGHHGWRSVFHYGDWLALDAPGWSPAATRGATDEGFIADVYYRKSALITAKTAEFLGFPEEAAYYGALAEKILAGILETYYAADGQCLIDTQTASLLTLSENICAPERAKTALEKQLRRAKWMLQTGFVGTPVLLDALTGCGMDREAYGLLLNEEYPGWLFEVKMGATTVWERWNSVGPDGVISPYGMNSLNHYAYGSVVQWIFAHAAGIQPDPSAPGFRKARIRPVMDARLGSVDASYKGYRVCWRIQEDGTGELCVTVPFDCEAEVWIPGEAESIKKEPGTYRFPVRTGH